MKPDLTISNRRAGLVAILLLWALIVLVAASSASAAEAVHPELGVFGSAEQPIFGSAAGTAVDQATGDVYAIDLEDQTLRRFHEDGTPADFSAVGTNVIDGHPGGEDETPQGAILGTEGVQQPVEAQVAIAPPGAAAGTAGDIYVTDAFPAEVIDIFEPTGKYIGQLSYGYACGVAVAPNGDVYIGDYYSGVHKLVPSAPATFTNTGNFPSTTTCQVAAGAGPTAGFVFATEYKGAVTKIASEGDGEGETAYTVSPGTNYTVAVDPASGHVYAAREKEAVEFDASAPAAPAQVSVISQRSTVVGLGVGGPAGSLYLSDEGSSAIQVFGPAVEPPSTEPATEVGIEAATLNGSVFPEGRQYTACSFEYGLESTFGFEHRANCEPEAAQIPADSSPHHVSLSLAGLEPNSDYKFRLIATNAAGPVEGPTLEFNTVGPPRISEALARDAEQASTTLEATLDPRGAATSYRIEWGPTNSYGNVATSGTISAGEGPTAVSARIGGLGPATTYHYRVVARSTEGGEAVSPDQQVETLDTCGFADSRCLELVSRADKGPIAGPGKLLTVGSQIQFQAAAGGSALAYTVYYGYPDATIGDASVYLGRRGPSGWSSEQLSPPTLAPPLHSANNSRIAVLSSNLDCGVVASSAPLDAGAPSTIVEAGGTNLYLRDNTTGSYETITSLPPVGPPSWEEVGHQPTDEYQVVGMSPDCRRVVFRGAYRYPGIPSVGGAATQLYEWDHGTLRNVAVIPGPGGGAEPVAVESIPGGLDEEPGNVAPLSEKQTPDVVRAVSVDGSRSIFTAASQFGGDSGRRAIFLRDTSDAGVLAGTVPATDVSQSETSTPNDGNSRYWIASADGTRIFFTARYGLAANASSVGGDSCANGPGTGFTQGLGEGCDLYEYDADAPAGARLSDLSADHTDAEGAGVVGVLAASEDGSYVYFAARGRLGGEGRFETENLEAATYNVYLAHAGTTEFVRSIGQAEAVGFSAHALVGTTTFGWNSSSTTDGTKLVFESALGIPGGVPMVYLFSAADGTTVCVSCRRDGRSPFAEAKLTPLVLDNEFNRASQVVLPTTLTDNGRLYFYSFDPLAAGAVEGDRNLYQWEHGQVSLIATESPDVPRSQGTPYLTFFGGAAADGGDVYFATPKRLIGAGPDEGWAVYDARVGGGFPEAGQPMPPCDALVEDACNGSGANAPTSVAPPTSGFAGPSNPLAKKKHKHHNKQKRRHHRKREREHDTKHNRHKQKHKVRAGKTQRGNDDRRAGK